MMQFLIKTFHFLQCISFETLCTAGGFFAQRKLHHYSRYYFEKVAFVGVDVLYKWTFYFPHVIDLDDTNDDTNLLFHSYSHYI